MKLWQPKPKPRQKHVVLRQLVQRRGQLHVPPKTASVKTKVAKTFTIAQPVTRQKTYRLSDDLSGTQVLGRNARNILAC